MQKYMGVKMIEAEPMLFGDYQLGRGLVAGKDPSDVFEDREGYRVQYPDGYVSWSPKEAFEAAYLPLLGDGTRITPEMVAAFADVAQVFRMGNHTVVEVVHRNGFTSVQSSACVDPANYNEAIGTQLALEKARNQIWECLGFVLAWALNGLQQTQREREANAALVEDELLVGEEPELEMPEPVNLGEDSFDPSN